MSEKNDKKVYKCRSIVKNSTGGIITGEAIVSKNAMCFYLCDPKTGTVIERNHPLQDKSIAEKILVLESGKGSSVVQVDGFYQLWTKGTLPKAIVLREAEPVIVSAAVVVGVPMVDRVEGDLYSLIHDGDIVEVREDEIIVTKP
jgi:predicted aconitase with swiveling domain